MGLRDRSARWLPAAAVGMALLIVGVAVALPLAPRGVVPADASPDEFSAERAAGELPAIAGRPHPTGSAANGAVREHLVRQLTARGLSPVVQERTAAREFPSGPAAVGRVIDVVARIPGLDPTGRVLVVAHYDSVMLGPGASDDGLGVTAILEIGRVLAAAGPQRNDVELLLTDGEEVGLLGARAFVDADPDLPARRTAVLNLEARGTSGPVVMFETGEGNSTVLPALRGAVPVATSVSDEVYRLLPNDTDFSEFRRAGFTGLNFAVVSGSAHYHTPTDDIAHADRASLQDMGTVALSAVRRLAVADLAEAGGDATYFSLAGLLVSYPSWSVLPIAVLVLVGLLAAARWRQRRLALRPRAVLVVAVVALLAPVIAGAVGWLAWSVLVGVRPHFDGFGSGDPYEPGVIAAGLTVVAAAVAMVWLVVVRRRARAVEVPVAAGLCFAVLGCVSAVAVPGAAYLFSWPALAVAVAVAIAGRTPGPIQAPAAPVDGSPWRVAVLTAALGLPALALFLPIVVLLFPTLGLALAAAPMAVVALVAAAALPPLPLPQLSRPAVAIALAVLVAGLGTVAVGVARNGVDAEHPAQVSLVYTLEADTGASAWAGGWGAPDPWLDRYVAGAEQVIDDRFPTLSTTPGYRLGPAPAAPVATPEVTMLASTESAGVRTVRLRLSAARGEAYQMALYVDTSAHELVSARVDGASLTGGRNRTASATVWQWGTYIYGLPAAGIEVELVVRGAGQVPVRVLAHSAGLPPGLAELPDTLTWTAQDAAGESIAGRTVRV